ncbi:hypothetical protein RJ55_07258 [Drechmeria coniospora]|nr:hypothetical protein RJ55_07258 [Drechmeria coniospora]
MSSARSPLCGSHADDSPASQTQPPQHSNVIKTALTIAYQSRDQAEATQHSQIQTREIQEIVQSAAGIEIPTEALRIIVLGFIRRLVRDVQGNVEAAHEFAEKCSLKLSPQDLKALAKFQGEIGAPFKFGEDSPCPVVKYMVISNRYGVYEDSSLNVVETEDAFGRLFQTVEKTAKDMEFPELGRDARGSLMDMIGGATAGMNF